MASARGARNAAVWGSQQLLDNQPKVLAELGAGYDAAQGFLGQAGDLYKGMTALGQQGTDLYGQLAGLGGSDAQWRALQSSPDFQFASDQGNQGLLRARAAQGMLASGNTDIDAMTFNQGLASQTLGAARNALTPYLGMYQQGIGGQSGVLGQQAGTATDYFGNRASVLDNTTKSIVGLGTEALKAGDAAKNANQANAINIGMGIGKLALGGLGGALPGGGGIGAGFLKVLGG